jgi:hypothetical protein
MSKRMTNAEKAERAERRRRAVRAVVVEIGPAGAAEDVGLVGAFDYDAPWLLVQKNLGAARSSQSHWFSRHRTKHQASMEWLGDEYREDWEPLMLVHLDSGDRFEPVLSVRWSPCS